MLDATELANELNLDSELDGQTLANLLADSQAMINGMIDKSRIDPTEARYKRACYSLATAMFYDRTLSQGIPPLVIASVVPLQVGVSDEN